jgi:V/A-type H+-transporting ATPase subunit A
MTTQGFGHITGISGSTVRVDVGSLRLYDRVYVGHAMLTGEVVRLGAGEAVVQVYEDARGLGVGEPVRSVGQPLTVRLGPGLLGGRYDGLQRPLERLEETSGPFIVSGKELYAIDYARPWRFHPTKSAGDQVTPSDPIGYVEEGSHRHVIFNGRDVRGRLEWVLDGEATPDQVFARTEDGGEIFGCHEWPVRTPRPFVRKFAPAEPLLTGQRIVDFLLPLARGGTAVLPGGFGTGKTVLEQTIARFTDVDLVVYVGCGERGNEMAELIESLAGTTDPWTGRPLMERTLLVANTSNMPVAAREASIYTAVTMAEYYRDMGYHVLLLADSLSRWAEALREISTTLEEMPGEESYPTYLASRLSGFIERAGVVETVEGKRGSLSMVLSTSPPGADFTEPVTQACLRVAGSFIMLDTDLAHRRHFPAINWAHSYSLYEHELAGPLRERFSDHWETARRRVREMLKREEELREITEIVGAEGLQDPDRLLMMTAGRIRVELLSQNAFSDDAFCPPERTLEMAEDILGRHDRLSARLESGVSLDDALREEEPQTEDTEEAS